MKYIPSSHQLLSYWKRNPLFNIVFPTSSCVYLFFFLFIVPCVSSEQTTEHRKIQKTMKKAKEGWTGAQCEEIETCLNKNNSKRAYQLVKDLTSEKQGRSSTIQNQSRKCLTEGRNSQQMDRILLRTLQL